MTLIRTAHGGTWSRDRPAWSDLTAAGPFGVPAAGGRFDRHHHDCDEYWLIITGRATVTSGPHTYLVGPGDLLCTPAGEEHDIVEIYGELTGFFFEGPLSPGGRPGHLHRDPAQATGHDVPCRPDSVLHHESNRTI